MKKCRKCQSELKEGELFCAACGTEQEDDLFATGPFEAAPEPAIAAPLPRPVIQKPAEPTLELDVKADACSVCGNPLRSADERTSGKCVQHLTPRRVSVRTQAPKTLPKQRNLAPVFLVIAAVALVSAALILRSKRTPKEPVPIAAEKSSEKPSEKTNAPPPVDAAALGRKLAADPDDSAEVAEYVAASGAHPRSDGTAEYAAMEALLDDTAARSPEETAKARAALTGISPDQMKKLEALASKHPNNAVVRDAVAESKLRLDPSAAFGKNFDGVGQALGRLKGLVLAARGEIAQATAVLREEAKKDPVAAHDLRMLLAQSGQCGEAEGLLRDDGSVGAALELAEFRVACKHDPAGAVNALDAARARPGLTPAKQASLVAAAALASLGDDKTREARCKSVDDPSLSALTREAYVRCGLVLGTSVCKVDPPEKSDWPWAAQALACKRPLKTKLSRSWDPAVSMLAAVAKLAQKKSPLAALDEAAPALLFGKWDGQPGYPMTPPELRALAKLAPAKTQPIANSVAAALAGETDAAAPAPIRLVLQAAAAYREGKPAPAAPQTTKLARFIKAATKKDKKALAKLLRDPLLGAFAFAELEQNGLATSAQRDAARKQFAGHPALKAKAK